MALLVAALVFTLSNFLGIAPAQAAATAAFDVTCSSVTLQITGAPSGTSYDLLVILPDSTSLYQPPVPTVGGAVTITLTFPSLPEGSYIYADTWQFSPLIMNFASINKRCGYDGIPVPPGFIFAEITCDVTVFQVPNPDFPTSARLRKGQTWFVNPKPVPAQIDTFYKEWTEVFVAGPRTGYIPTACVNPVPRFRR
ncbi:MAG: hypothetical protein CUN49_03505 [Candidatus Thermofonsia Clade 1 bacterium]|uniref:SH3b domain-containing protein n=1 Tax=Candidatus Thermofonsia Clade 1 bacterium TaxID=2364210 RepID=A0A2M8PH06_9CHLR|nr:MAG: hypothetical protein CUN49_03505 [Candidatus Thermofonsia Clade 1 bacterium]RMF51227.1 MAG: hypothetical protein D6749_08520 [Chloroflexota bacterium]